MRHILILSLSVGLSGCSLLPHMSAMRPSQTVQTTSIDPYTVAVGAIREGDDAKALEWLQRAHAEGESVRILNAYGVVYDNLGRFDLSAKYYARAEALDPGSPIVAANRAYSRQLQESAAALDMTPPAEIKRQAAADVAAPLAQPAIEQTLMASRGLIGRPIQIVDASRGQQVGRMIAERLRSRGWSVAPVKARSSPEPTSAVEYDQNDQRVAKALVRTLGRPVAMSTRAASVGIRFVVADDFHLPATFGPGHVHGERG